MKLNLALASFSNVILLSASSLLAQLATDPAGFNRVPCPGGSDTVISIPFTLSPAFTGKLGLAPSGAVIVPGGEPNFTVDEFASSPHYLRFRGDSTLAGAWYDIVANDAQSITVDSQGDDLSAAATDDLFDIVPHWTLASMWPEATQDSLHPSSSKLLSGRGSSVFFADSSASGVNLAPDQVYFLTDEGWFQAAAGFPAADDTVIPPGQSLVIRHQSGAEDTIFYTMNLVHRDDQQIWLKTSTAGPSDNHIGIARPIPVSLVDLDLGPSVFVDSASTDLADRADELLVYDNTDVRQNKVPEKVYFRVGGDWHEDDGATYPVANTDEIEPSAGLVLRKSPTVDGAPVLWVNSPRY